jgi:hypothetical protein
LWGYGIWVVILGLDWGFRIDLKKMGERKDNVVYAKRGECHPVLR